MSLSPVLPLLYVQELGPAGKQASDIATRPELASAMNKAMADELLKQEAQQVQKIDQSSNGVAITDDEEEKAKQNFSQQHSREKQEDEAEEASQSLDPFVGKLINKVV